MSISIHAPRGGSDNGFMARNATISISIHAPRGGERLETLPPDKLALLFQSTLPVGGATIIPCVLEQNDFISIHAPRGGSDGPLILGLCCQVHFNPRSPWGERRWLWLTGWR